MNQRGQLGDSTILLATGIILLGIVFIWLAVNVIEPTQGIFQMVSNEVADATGTSRVTHEYTPDYTVLFLVPAGFAFLYLYVKNKQMQERHHYGEQDFSTHR